MLASYFHTFAGMGLSRSFQGSTSVLVSFSGSQMRDTGVKFGRQELLNIGCAHMHNDDNVDDNEDHLQVLTDPHSPGQFRVNGPFKNLREFSQVRYHADNIWKSFKKKELIIFVGVGQIDNSDQIIYRQSLVKNKLAALLLSETIPGHVAN